MAYNSIHFISIIRVSEGPMTYVHVSSGDIQVSVYPRNRAGKMPLSYRDHKSTGLRVSQEPGGKDAPVL